MPFDDRTSVDRPILFSPDMIRAILAGRKTQTRRVVQPQPDPGGVVRIEAAPNPDYNVLMIDARHLYGTTTTRPVARAGDRFYVREAWHTTTFYDDMAPRDLSEETPICYHADQRWQTWGWKRDHGAGRFRQGMHMPKWASRITLHVTDVRVERVQDISHEDAIAEGCPGFYAPCAGDGGVTDGITPAEDFQDLWNTLNAPRGYGWDVNPWVTATTFEPEFCNISEARG